jgi:hypothetical protein
MDIFNISTVTPQFPWWAVIANLGFGCFSAIIWNYMRKVERYRLLAHAYAVLVGLCCVSILTAAVVGYQRELKLFESLRSSMANGKFSVVEGVIDIRDRNGRTQLTDRQQIVCIGHGCFTIGDGSVNYYCRYGSYDTWRGKSCQVYYVGKYIIRVKLIG